MCHSSNLEQIILLFWIKYNWEKEEKNVFPFTFDPVSYLSFFLFLLILIIVSSFQDQDSFRVNQCARATTWLKQIEIFFFILLF